MAQESNRDKALKLFVARSQEQFNRPHQYEWDGDGAQVLKAYGDGGTGLGYSYADLVLRINDRRLAWWVKDAAGDFVVMMDPWSKAQYNNYRHIRAWELVRHALDKLGLVSCNRHTECRKNEEMAYLCMKETRARVAKEKENGSQG